MNSRSFLLAPALVLALGGAAQAADMSAEEALQAAREQRVVLVDVRTPAEWKQTGVAPGAARISVTGHPQGDSGFVADVAALLRDDRSRPVALICRTGRRSAMARQLLERNGFTQVHNVDEGMAGSAAGPGWLARGLPTEPCPTC
ncbi:MAG: rhodanese-like domain-containing protein [Pseudomonadales bacterium]|nr:rhodanese-like domain-containing protein [Pseudomonadales bacterium]MBP9033977.1 rhodanese-like domain-containing protein [Pseudomonadales bacterium]